MNAKECVNDVQPVAEGNTVFCDGFLFSHAAEKQAEQYRADADFYKKYSDQLNAKIGLEENENDVLQKRLNLYIQESSQLAKEQASKNTTEDLIRIGCFSLGVLVTALIVRNVRN